MDGSIFASCRIKSHKRRRIRLSDEMQLPEPKQKARGKRWKISLGLCLLPGNPLQRKIGKGGEEEK